MIHLCIYIICVVSCFCICFVFLAASSSFFLRGRGGRRTFWTEKTKTFRRSIFIKSKGEGKQKQNWGGNEGQNCMGSGEIIHACSSRSSSQRESSFVCGFFFFQCR
jgi:hypothetical protein